MHELAASIRGSLDKLTMALCEAKGIAPEKVGEMAVTGNTTMMHLFADVDPSSMGEAPFTVPDYFGDIRSAVSLGLKYGGQVYLARCISAFVGGDITSAILSSGMRDDKASLLLDIGTNGEVALHADGKLYVTSTAAGAGLRGGGALLWHGCGEGRGECSGCAAGRDSDLRNRRCCREGYLRFGRH